MVLHSFVTRPGGCGTGCQTYAGLLNVAKPFGFGGLGGCEAPDLVCGERMIDRSIESPFTSSANDQSDSGHDRWITQLCRRAGFRPKFVQEAVSVSNLFTLIVSEGAVALVPSYLKHFPVAGVAMVELLDRKATWDFLVVWQRGRTAKSLRELLDALAGVSHRYPGLAVSS